MKKVPYKFSGDTMVLKFVHEDKYLIIGMDSLGFTVIDVTEDPNEASVMSLKEARDVHNSLDVYWAVQTHAWPHPDMPFWPQRLVNVFTSPTAPRESFH